MHVTDQLHRAITFNFPPLKIISLVPSQSELLWYLGVQKELIGITKFCIHPNEMFRSVIRVGGTKKINFQAIQKLKPQLIIANKEENEQEQIEELCKQYPVWISDIYNLNDAMNMILQVGIITDREDKAQELVTSISEKHHHFKIKNSEFRIERTVAYLIWKDPYMAAAQSTFITEMLKECGLINVFTNEKSRYPEITVQNLVDKKPELLFLSSEPYPFKEKHIAELKTYLPHSKIMLVDGEMFSWYGSRLLHAFDYFEKLLATV